MVMTFPQFIYSFYCCFSGTTIFDDYYITFYNMLFTCFPLVIRAILDQDVYYKNPLNLSLIQLKANPMIETILSERRIVKKYYPKLYFVGQKNIIFTNLIFCRWIFSSLYQAFLFFFFVFLSYNSNIISLDGYNNDFWSVSITLFTVIILCVNVQLGLYTYNWTIIFFFTFSVLSIFIYFAYVWFSNFIQYFTIYQTAVQLFSSFNYYGSIFLVVASMLIFELLFFVILKDLYPNLIDYYRILIKTDHHENESFFKTFNLYLKSSKLYKGNLHTVVDKRKPSALLQDLKSHRKKKDLNEKKSHFNQVKTTKKDIDSVENNYSQQRCSLKITKHIIAEGKMGASFDEISEDSFIKHQSLKPDNSKIILN